MTNIKVLLKCLWQDESGQSTTEYIMILAVVVMVATKFKSAFSTSLGTIVQQLTGQISNSMTQDGSP